jgi:hypothetical protein
MPLSLFGLGMLVAQPAPFQLFTSLTPCPARASLPNAITEHDYLPAPARALRVGIYPIVGHANCNVNIIQINDLPTEHAQTLGVIGRATQCQNKGNLLTSRAIVRSASVPRPAFTTLNRKFFDTLTPTRRCVCAVSRALRACPTCFDLLLTFHRREGMAEL